MALPRIMGALLGLSLCLISTTEGSQISHAAAFSAHFPRTVAIPAPGCLRKPPSSVASLPSFRSGSGVKMASAGASVEDEAPLVRVGRSVKVGKVSLSAVGVLFLLSELLWTCILYPVLGVSYLIARVTDNEKRRLVDWVVGWWAKCAMMTCTYKPKIVGAEKLLGRGQAVLYAPNHCSYLDIFSLSGFLPRRVKYVSKVEVLKIPLIGWAMSMAKHIALRRDSRKSQMRTFKDAVESMKAGNSLVTFPEGTRSPDGRLGDFKAGPIKMAMRAGVPVVPVTICGTHLYMPPNAALPIAMPRGVTITVHDPIPTDGSLTEKEILEQTRAAVASALPAYMQAAPDTE